MMKEMTRIGSTAFSKIPCNAVASSLYSALNLNALRRRTLSTCSTDKNDSAVDIASILKKCLPGMDVTTNPYDCAQHGKGESHHTSSHVPAVVAYPRSTDDVQTIVGHCMQHRIPIIPFGAGTSVEGHVNALYKNTLSLDLTRLQKIQIHDDENGSDSGIVAPVVTVGAGVRRHQLNEALRHTGLYFTVDPGADATIGGMVATGASGTTTIRYGTMRDNILGLTCIVAGRTTTATINNETTTELEPTLVHAGTRGGALKNSAGYDLLSLFCGSEGTLGVITEVTLKLHPRPEHVVAATCTFSSLHAAAQAVANLQLLGGNNLGLTRCELLDSDSIQAFNDYNTDDQVPSRPVQPTLFLELEGCSETALSDQVAMAEAICREEDVDSNMEFELAWEANARHALWKARHSLYYAAIASRKQIPPAPPSPKTNSSSTTSSSSDKGDDDDVAPMGAIVTDACVPIFHLADVITATSADVKELGLYSGPCFGHAGVSGGGSGNPHASFTFIHHMISNNPFSLSHWTFTRMAIFIAFWQYMSTILQNTGQSSISFKRI